MPKRILLADDSITIQKVVELTFSDGDYEIITANNGARALQKLSESTPDIILSDIIMPEKNGYEVCEFIKSHPEYRDIPVILLTGTFEPFDPDRAEKAGCDAVVTKPFESQALINKVEELIQRRRGSDDERRHRQLADMTPAAAAVPVQSPAPEPMAEPEHASWNIPTFTPFPDETPQPEAAAPPEESPFGSEPWAETQAPPAAEEPFGVFAEPAPQQDSPRKEEPAFEDLGPEPIPIDITTSEAYEAETKAFPIVSSEQSDSAAPSEQPWGEPAATEPSAEPMGRTLPFPRLGPTGEESPSRSELSLDTNDPGVMPFASDWSSTPAERPEPRPTQAIPIPPESNDQETGPLPAIDDPFAVSSEVQSFQPAEAPAFIPVGEQMFEPTEEPPYEVASEPAYEPEAEGVFEPEMTASPESDMPAEEQPFAPAEEPLGAPMDYSAAPEPPADFSEPQKFEPIPEEEPSYEEPVAFEDIQPEALSQPETAFPPPPEPERVDIPSASGEAATVASDATVSEFTPAYAVPEELPQAGPGRLSDEDVERIARKAVELMSEQMVRNIAWEIIPDMAEMVVRERIKELENQE
jgi:CheY-like chemotaxis protein